MFSIFLHRIFVILSYIEYAEYRNFNIIYSLNVHYLACVVRTINVTVSLARNVPHRSVQ